MSDLEDDAYYWVRCDSEGGWQPAQYSEDWGRKGAFWLCGTDIPFFAPNDFPVPRLDEIGERIDR